MKTFEMKVAGKAVEFSTKSIRIDGTEYFYGKMSDIRHSAKKHVYAFKYGNNDKAVYLPYDVKYAEALKTIFKQVNALSNKSNKAKSAEAAKEVKVAQALALKEAKAAEMLAADEASQIARDLAAVSEAVATHTEAPAQTSEVSEETVSSETASEEENAPDAQQSKKGSLKKALIVFAAILVVIAAMSAAYFALFGTSGSPNVGPNSMQTQQYDDIDKMIDELE